VKPSHFFADTEYSIGTSDFRFSFASLLLSLTPNIPLAQVISVFLSLPYCCHSYSKIPATKSGHSAQIRRKFGVMKDVRIQKKGRTLYVRSANLNKCYA